MKRSLLVLVLLFTSWWVTGQQLTGISPNEGDAGSTLNVTITGLNTHFVQATQTGVRFYFGSATSTVTYPNSVTPMNNQALGVNFTIPPGTKSGWYTFDVFNYIDGYMVMPNGFKVNGPAINTITPNQGEAGTTLNVTITGINTHFTQATNTAVRFYFSGATTTATYPNSVTVQSNSTLQANLTIPPGTAEGWYDFSVDSWVDGYLLKSGGFRVTTDIGVADQRPGDPVVEIYPNPFTNRFFIRFNNFDDEALVLKLFDLSGQLLDEQVVTLRQGEAAYLPPALKPGLFHLMIIRSDGSVVMRQVVRTP
jgi:hypothetical protein